MTTMDVSAWNVKVGTWNYEARGLLSRLAFSEWRLSEIAGVEGGMVEDETLLWDGLRIEGYMEVEEEEEMRVWEPITMPSDLSEEETRRMWEGILADTSVIFDLDLGHAVPMREAS